MVLGLKLKSGSWAAPKKNREPCSRTPRHVYPLSLLDERDGLGKDRMARLGDEIGAAGKWRTKSEKSQPPQIHPERRQRAFEPNAAALSTRDRVKRTGLKTGLNNGWDEMLGCGA